MVELIKKLTKVGNGYAILIPKALVECKVLDLNEEVLVKIERTKEGKALIEICTRNPMIA